MANAEIYSSSNGGSQPTFEDPQPTFEDPPSTFEDPPSTFEDPPSTFEDPPSTFEDPPPTLGDDFLFHLKRSMFDTKQDFLPEGYLDRFITRQALKDDLFVDKAGFDAKDERLIDFITTSAKKVFATAYCALGSGGSALLPTMMYFHSIGFSDKALPIDDLRTVEPTRNAQTEVPFPFNRNRNMILRRTWAPMRIRNFYQTQWMFLAPIFERGHFHHVLSSHVVLPFVWVSKVTKGGRFSKVYEVEIHKSHQRLLDVKDDGTQPHVAIKEILTTENDEDLKQEIENNFNLEASALSDIASLEHDHIIERIAAISIDTRRYFMFQWADGGNLREFWKENSNPHLNPELVRQSVHQLRGLADALVALHHYKDKANYRHGDLKPENVLRFNDGTFVGHFKIADMGLAKRHTEATDARGGPTSMKYGTTRYEPPETSTNLLSARSRLYDVWSLGCIILEYIIWLLYGYDELERFSDDIQIDTGCFYLCERGGDRPEAKVHPTVVTWMDCVGNDPECSTQTAIRDLLALVRDKLLVVALLTDSDTKSGFDDFISVTPADLVEPVPVAAVRARAKAVESALQEILDLGEGNENYLLANRTRLEIQRPSLTIKGKANSSLKVPEAHKPKGPGPHANGSVINSKDVTT
ncbi:putative cell division protein kinase [Colletotrichum siamense]|nr:putative cell division protein kinase [Colletotrichum siamense]